MPKIVFTSSAVSDKPPMKDKDSSEGEQTETLMHRVYHLKSYQKEGIDKTALINVGFAENFKSGLMGQFKNANGDKFPWRPHEIDHYNYFISLAKCSSGNARNDGVLSNLIFDIDYIPTNEKTVNKQKEYVRHLAATLRKSPDEFTTINTGNGLHIICEIEPFPEDMMFRLQNNYKRVALEYQKILRGKKLTGIVDSNIFSPKKMTRINGSINFNIKKSPDPQTVKVMQLGVGKLDLEETLQTTQLGDDFIHEGVASRLRVDGAAVLEGCDFLKSHRSGKADEPQWYAMLGIAGRIDPKIAHELSKNHPKYSEVETGEKLKHALTAPPRSCKGIDRIWGKCKDCTHFGQLASPLQIKGSDFITTEATGFRMFKSDGSLGGYECNDVAEANKQLDSLYNIGPQVFTYDETTHIWSSQNLDSTSSRTAYLDNTLERVIPKDVLMAKPVTMNENNNIRQIFLKKTIRKALAIMNGMAEHAKLKIPLKNGTFDFERGELIPHQRDHYLFYANTYEYSAEAKCPRFDRFMDEITDCGNVAVQKQRKILLMDMMTSIVANTPIHNNGRFYILLGSGSNGKSILTETVSHLIGQTYVTHHDFTETRRASSLPLALMTARMNLTEEPVGNILNKSVLQTLKALTTKAQHDFRDIGGKSVPGSTNVKLVFCTNELGEMQDKKLGARRRVAIVKFDKNFDGTDTELKATLEREAAGILNRVIEHYQQYQKRHFRTKSEDHIESEQIIQEKVSENELYDFIVERYHIVPSEVYLDNYGNCVPTENKLRWEPLNRLFEDYCMYDKNYRRGRRMFSRDVRSLLFEFTKKSLFVNWTLHERNYFRIATEHGREQVLPLIPFSKTPKSPQKGHIDV